LHHSTLGSRVTKKKKKNLSGVRVLKQSGLAPLVLNLRAMIDFSVIIDLRAKIDLRVRIDFGARIVVSNDH